MDGGGFSRASHQNSEDCAAGPPGTGVDSAPSFVRGATLFSAQQVLPAGGLGLGGAGRLLSELHQLILEEAVSGMNQAPDPAEGWQGRDELRVRSAAVSPLFSPARCRSLLPCPWG